MTIFLRLLGDKHKAQSLLAACTALRSAGHGQGTFEVSPAEFEAVPGSPFCYWVSPAIRNAFARFPVFEGNGRTAKVGLATADDFRFVRAWWEIVPTHGPREYPSFAKGGGFSQYYADFPLVLKWEKSGGELKESVISQHGNAGKRVYNEEYYFKPAITWPLRAHRFSPQALPAESIFSVRGYTAHFAVGEELASLALLGSSAFDYLFKTALGRFGYPEFIVGILQVMPWARLPEAQDQRLADLAHRAWSLKRSLDTVRETSRAFLLPFALRSRAGGFEPPEIEAELLRIQNEIDRIAFDVYEFSDVDRAVASGGGDSPAEEEKASVEEEDGDDQQAVRAESSDGLLSWCVGVVFGRFDWRLATGARDLPPEPGPFDALQGNSPGMLLEDAKRFHTNTGILVDDPGHPDDLAHIVEEVLVRVDVTPLDDVRRWLQRDFFPFHLRHYSKSRRRAPIYWPLATASGSYTLWLYSPNLTSQTLYTAVNDFVEPKLKQVGDQVTALRNKGSARTRDDEKQFETLQAFNLELIELRDVLLKLAPAYSPNADDGVQISAAPLWPLFRHKPWQKLLKETWAKLEKGEYDWAHLAMNYWPERVREKCKSDKSLAIAHGLEDVYVAPEAAPKKMRSRKKAKGDE